MEDNDTIFTDINETETEASGTQRFFTNMVDILASILLIVVVFKLLPHEIVIMFTGAGVVWRYVFVFLLMEVYRLTMLLVFGKTLGMMVCKLKYLNASLKPLSVKEKLIASIAVRTARIRHYKNNSQH